MTATEAEYLALESTSTTRHEFVNGVIIAMAGAQPAHNILAMNVGTALGILLRDTDCVVMSSDQRLHIPATGLYAYPDLTVACGEREYRDTNPPSLLNPTILVEITSDTTEDYDRGTKFLHYQSIASLREYVIVSHRERRIDHLRRLETGQWLATTFTRDDAEVELTVHPGKVRLADIFAKVDLGEGIGPRS